MDKATEMDTTDDLPPRLRAMKRVACPECPFRSTSRLGYDPDAMECLRRSGEPACHAVVGLESIFAHATFYPEENIACVGYHAWRNHERGFKRPKCVGGL